MTVAQAGSVKNNNVKIINLIYNPLNEKILKCNIANLINHNGGKEDNKKFL
jgi:hypothetical protein